MNQSLEINKKFHLAVENHKKNNFKIAEELYEEILKVYPNNPETNFLLGSLLLDTNNLGKAKFFLEKTIKIKPNNSHAQNNLGTVYSEIGEIHKAKKCYEKAIEIEPSLAEAHSNLGKKFKELGELKEAINCFQNALKYKSESLLYYFYLSELQKNFLDFKLKSKIETITKTNNSTKNDIVYGNFLLSRYEKKEKNYKKELDYLEKGHHHQFESKKKIYINEVNQWLNILPKINEIINFHKYEKNSNKSKNKITPIYIVGVPRCGSTLVEKIIASGIETIPMGEEVAILHTFIKSKIMKEGVINLDIINVEREIIKRYEKKGLINKKSNFTFTDKSLENFFYLQIIKEIYPNAKIIHCKRNVLSSIMSIFQNNLSALAWTHDLKHIFKYFDNYFKIMKNYKKFYPNFIYELEFEKLVNNPEIESKKLMKFCGLPWDKKCLEFYKRKDFYSKTASNIQIRQAIYKHSVDKYLPYKEFLKTYGEKYSWFNNL